MTHSETKLWTAYTDGASRGNPGLAGCGALITSPDGREFPFKKFLGERTNNYAEYQALILALGELGKLGAETALIRADSEFMIKQMRGEYKVKNANIIPLYQEAKRLAASIPMIKFEHVRREFNKDADRLANEAIDER
jgi:ribonuclease HI